jgi:hypothetical protein
MVRRSPQPLAGGPPLFATGVSALAGVVAGLGKPFQLTRTGSGVRPDEQQRF